jgi:hypothetical protein
VLVQLADDHNINFKVSVCKLICCKDTGRLLEETILERLTSGLEIIATFELHLFTDEGGSLVAEFCPRGQIQNPTTMSHTPITEVFVTGDLAFQAIALGKESIAGHWCMQCKASRLQFMNDCKLWMMEELVRCGADAEIQKKEIRCLGLKKNHGGHSYLCRITWFPSNTAKSG